MRWNSLGMISLVTVVTVILGMPQGAWTGVTEDPIIDLSRNQPVSWLVDQRAQKGAGHRKGDPLTVSSRPLAVVWNIPVNPRGRT